MFNNFDIRIPDTRTKNDSNGLRFLIILTPDRQILLFLTKIESCHILKSRALNPLMSFVDAIKLSIMQMYFIFV